MEKTTGHDIVTGRQRNESRFPQWEELPNGGRRYYRIIRGRVKGYARYVKEVDANESTVQIVQEIYDEAGNLVGIHQSFPEDTGHIEIGRSEDDV